MYYIHMYVHGSKRNQMTGLNVHAIQEDKSPAYSHHWHQLRLRSRSHAPATKKGNHGIVRLFFAMHFNITTTMETFEANYP